MLTLGDKLRRRAKYVEGAYTTNEGFVADFAWLETGRRVIDPTLAAQGKDYKEVFYFSRNRYSFKFVKENFAERDGVEPFWSLKLND